MLHARRQRKADERQAHPAPRLAPAGGHGARHRIHSRPDLNGRRSGVGYPATRLRDYGRAPDRSPAQGRRRAQAAPRALRAVHHHDVRPPHPLCGQAAGLGAAGRRQGPRHGHLAGHRTRPSWWTPAPGPRAAATPSPAPTCRSAWSSGARTPCPTATPAAATTTATQQLWGYSLTHISGPGCGAAGDVPILPMTGGAAQRRPGPVHDLVHQHRRGRAGRLLLGREQPARTPSPRSSPRPRTARWAASPSPRPPRPTSWSS